MSQSTTHTTALSRAIAAGGGRLIRTRWLMRAPIWIYRARLGFIFGSRILMLEHIGRKSGARRSVVLEVVGHPTPDSYVVASAFGTRAQWFRNVQANPQVRVYVRSHRPAAAAARVLSTAEADAVLAAYVARYPRAWNRLKPVIENTLGTAIAEQDTELPMIELHLTRTS